MNSPHARVSSFLVLLILAVTFIQAGELRTTLDQTFNVNGTWVRAADLRAGDIIQTYDGKRIRISNVTDVETRAPIPTYGLRTENTAAGVILGDGVIAQGNASALRIGSPQNASKQAPLTRALARLRSSLAGWLRRRP